MTRFAGKTHARLIFCFVLIGFCCTAVFANAVLRLQSSTEREQVKIKRDQLALLVNSLSQGKSRLMLKTGTPANPGSGRFNRASIPGDGWPAGFATVYPVTVPINTRLPMAPAGAPMVNKYGRILGAVEVIEPVGGPEDKEKAGAGVYLLFVPISGPMTSEMPLWLVSVTVGDDGKVTYVAGAHTTVKITRSETSSVDRSPAVKASIDFLTASVSMTWSTQTYTFGFQMEIMYL